MLGLKNIGKSLAVALVAALALLASRFALADTMSSTNYKVQADVMSVGGGRSTSTNFIGDDTVGDLGTGTQSSTNFQACAGYECFQGAPYISFTVKQGTSSPGTTGAGVALGALTTGSVTTSNGTTINSVFITAESNAPSGTVVTVVDANAALKRISTPDTIPSSTATLTAGVAGYGICVFSATQDAGSPTAFTAQAPFASTCTKTTGHSVGGLTTSPQTVLSSPGALLAGTSEILVKAAISTTTAAGSDYADTLTFIATGTY
ncbi:MAG TPA: hypothetical protein VL426_05585 [Candidatus Binatia bacterium]|jgi:hypothetical protein|nr:hypothetical protein [Candidatus Binatia bacterium]